MKSDQVLVERQFDSELMQIINKKATKSNLTSESPIRGVASGLNLSTLYRSERECIQKLPQKTSIFKSSKLLEDRIISEIRKTYLAHSKSVNKRQVTIIPKDYLLGSPIRFRNSNSVKPKEILSIERLRSSKIPYKRHINSLNHKVLSPILSSKSPPARNRLPAIKST